MTKTGYVLLVLGLFTFAGCQKETRRVEAEVVDISGTLPLLMSSTGALFGNDSVKLGEASLILTIKEPNGHIRTLNVLNRWGITKAAVLSRTCVGSEVSFTVTVVDTSPKELAQDPYYHMSSIYADDLLIQRPCLQQEAVTEAH